MKDFVMLFTLSGLVLGLFLQFAPHLFQGVAVHSSTGQKVVSESKIASSEVLSKSESEDLGYQYTKIVNIEVNERSFDIALTSLDKVSILGTARQFCNENAPSLNIPQENVEAGCVKAVANHLFSEVFGKEMTQYPITLSIPIHNHGFFDIQFDILHMSPRKVAETFCGGKQVQFGIPDERLEVDCISNVEAFIVNELIERGVVERNSGEDQAAASVDAPTQADEIHAVTEAAPVASDAIETHQGHAHVHAAPNTAPPRDTAEVASENNDTPAEELV